MINRLYVGGQALDAKLGLDVTGTTFETDKIEGQVFINVGDFSWGLSIPESKLNDVIIRFNDFIKTKKEQYSKNFKKRKLEIEQYLYEVKKCVKAGGKSMDCKIQVRDIIDKKDKEEKAAKKSKVSKKK